MASILPAVLPETVHGVEAANGACAASRRDNADPIANALKQIAFVAACIDLHELRLSLDEALRNVEAEKRGDGPPYCAMIEDEAA